jgi:hypothetical protein
MPLLRLGQPSLRCEARGGSWSRPSSGALARGPRSRRARPVRPTAFRPRLPEGSGRSPPLEKLPASPRALPPPRFAAAWPSSLSVVMHPNASDPHSEPSFWHLLKLRVKKRTTPPAYPGCQECLTRTLSSPKHGVRLQRPRSRKFRFELHFGSICGIMGPSRAKSHRTASWTVKREVPS